MPTKKTQIRRSRFNCPVPLFDIKTRKIVVKAQYDGLIIYSSSIGYKSLIGYNLNEKWGLISYQLGMITIVTKPQFLDMRSYALEVLVEGFFGNKWRRIDAETGNFID